jgi:ankyrin repeat protein
VEHGAPLETVSRASIAQVRPLGTAAFSGDAEAARVLLEAGADPNGAGGGGGTPLQTARENGNEELVGLLEEFGATD